MKQEVLKITEYLNYVKIGDSGKTITVGVGNNQGEKLGIIKWHGAWRKYVFIPMADIIFDTKCLSDVINFINELMDDRKKK